LSNISYWVPEPSIEPAIRAGSEPELYYFPLQLSTFIKPLESKESNSIRQVVRGYISSLINMLSRSAHSIEIYDDSLYGTVARITIDLSAKDALDLWLKLIDYLPYEKYGVILSVKWLGENDVSEDELINYIVKIMVKSKIGPKALPGFDATRMVQEVREE